MKPAVGLVLTAIVLNSVGATTTLANFKPSESEAGSTPTVGLKKLSWDFNWDAPGSDDTSGSDDSCNEVGSTDYEPVCASDGVTYANYCAFSIAQSKAIDLTFLALGECAGGSSSDEAKAGSAAATCPETCRDIYDPVSDEKGTIYTNDCLMQKAKCNDTKKDVNDQADFKTLYMRLIRAIMRAHSTDDDSSSEESESSSTLTTKEKKSTTAGMLRTIETSSASDSGIGSLYGDDADDIIGSGSLSPTTECASTCLDIYSPVCGSDGVSYINSCQLELTACKDPNLKIVRISDDDCADSEATTTQEDTTTQDDITTQERKFQNRE